MCRIFSYMLQLELCICIYFAVILTQVLGSSKET